YRLLFKPKLLDPLKSYLDSQPCVPTLDGGWAKPSDTVRIAEDSKAFQALIGRGIFLPKEIASAFGGSPDLHVVHPEVRDGVFQARPVDRQDLLRNGDFLKLKAEDKCAAGWFQKLYFWLKEYPQWESCSKGR